jgi:hypothetical protein
VADLRDAVSSEHAGIRYPAAVPAAGGVLPRLKETIAGAYAEGPGQ